MSVASFMSELNTLISSNEIIIPNSTSSTSSNEPKNCKVLIVSTHVMQNNGYSKVIYSIIKQLSSKPWLSLVHFGTQKLQQGEVDRTYPSNVKVIDGSALEKEKLLGFAFSELSQVIQNEKPDIVFIYNDLSIITHYIEHIRKYISIRSFKIWAYADVTSLYTPSNIIDILNRDVDRIYCMTNTWKTSLLSQGIIRPIDVLSHGYDPSIYRTLPREIARQSLGLPKDVFLITSLNQNIPRKHLDILIMAFVHIIVRFPLSPIYMLIVADKGDRGGYPLFEIYSRELKLQNASVDIFGNRLMLTSSPCFKDIDINVLNNCADIGVSCAEGEGFGLCSFEQMAVGIPQIVPNINGYTEYCNQSNSILVTPTTRLYLPKCYSALTSETLLVSINDISKAIETYLFDTEKRKIHGESAKKTVANYTWENAVAPLLKRLSTIHLYD